jgi:hypothetical protein
LYYNGSQPVPPSSVEVPHLAELVTVVGTQRTHRHCSGPSCQDAGTKPADKKAVVNVSFVGITFTGQRPTYMEPHGIPSGGDR